MAKARPLSFHATDVEAEAGPHEVVSVAFTVESDDDDARPSFSMMAEDGDDSDGTVVRVTWSDGKDGREESVVGLASVALTATRFDLAFADPRPASLGPCASVAITFDALEPATASLLSRALFQLASSLGDAFTAPAAVATKIVPTGPRRFGAPNLGITASAAPWRANVSGELTLALTLTNLGGALEGLQIEIGGAALDGGLVVGRIVTGDGSEAKLEAKGNVAIASLPTLRVPADFDVDRRADKKAAPAPTIALGAKLACKRAGSGLLTVRVRPLGRTAGSAMVGRTVVID